MGFNLKGIRIDSEGLVGGHFSATSVRSIFDVIHGKNTGIGHCSELRYLHVSRMGNLRDDGLYQMEFKKQYFGKLE